MRKKYRIAKYSIRRNGEIRWCIEHSRLGWFWTRLIDPSSVSMTWTFDNLEFAEQCVRNLEHAQDVKYKTKSSQGKTK